MKGNYYIFIINMKIKIILNQISLSFISLTIVKKIYLRKYSNYLIGNPGWFIFTELKYGGISINVKRVKVSPDDPRSSKQIKSGGMTGGDRMLHHNYAKKYSQYLLPYIKKQNIVLIEIGILKGVGLAIWCDLFPKERIIGFDIDLNHIKNNMDNLKNLGAFKNNVPELHEFDQFQDNTNYVASILMNNTIDICIDDGFHSDESIIITLKSIMPNLSKQFVYIIEDNRTVYKKISSFFPECNIDNKGELTILTRKN